MPPSRSGLLVKFSAATAFSGVAQGSQLFWPFCKQSNPSRFQPQRACGPWQPGHPRESLPWPHHLVGDLQGGGGGQESAAWVSLSWGNAVAFINCNGSCQKKKKKKKKGQYQKPKPKKTRNQIRNNPLPTSNTASWNESALFLGCLYSSFFFFFCHSFSFWQDFTSV